MRYLHTMVRVLDLNKSLQFYKLLGLKEMHRSESEKGRYTLVFLATDQGEPMVELTYNWDQTEAYSVGRNFGHLAYEVDDIYSYCSSLMEAGIQIARPPRDGRMAFVRSPDQVSVEILQRGHALPLKEPWISMPNCGEW